MSETLTNLRDLLARYKRANSGGAVKVANGLIPDIGELIIQYVDEQTGKAPQRDAARHGLTGDRVALNGNAAPTKQILTEGDEVLTPFDIARHYKNQPTVAEADAAIKEALVAPVVEEEAPAPVVPAFRIDLRRLNEAEQEAYIEAQRRVQNLVNNGARYLGEEDLVEKFVAQITGQAETCAPCTEDVIKRPAFADDGSPMGWVGNEWLTVGPPPATDRPQSFVNGQWRDKGVEGDVIPTLDELPIADAAEADHIVLEHAVEKLVNTTDVKEAVAKVVRKRTKPAPKPAASAKVAPKRKR